MICYSFDFEPNNNRDWDHLVFESFCKYLDDNKVESSKSLDQCYTCYIFVLQIIGLLCLQLVVVLV